MLAARTRFHRKLTVITMPLSTPVPGSITTTSAADLEHLDELVLDVQRQANEVCWEMYLYHRHQADFRETYKTARQTWGLAGRIHEPLHGRSGSIGLVQKELDELSRLVHQITDDVTHWDETAIDVHDHTAPAPTPVRRMRRGGNMKTLHAKLRALEDSVHDLLGDTKLLARVQHNPPVTG